MHDMRFSPASFFNRSIPLWVLLFLLLIFAGLSSALFIHYRTTIVRYSLSLPSPADAPVPLHYGAWPALEHAEFFKKVHDRLVAEKATFIEADLSAMKLAVYSQGEQQFEVPIQTKGRKGSWWETPAGLYEIGSKEENHLSSIGNVYMPWSMQFQGNFFIHGWPYYPNGTDVSTEYSGGCIRLSSEDAKRVYDAIGIGTPILVFENSFVPDSFSYELAAPLISAEAYLVADLRSNSVLARKNPNAHVPIGAISRLMNALVSVEHIDLDRDIFINSFTVSDASRRLSSGRAYTTYELLHPLLLEGSRMSAEALASHLGRRRSVDLFNASAASFGMPATSFTGAFTNDPYNRSTPEDLFSFAKHLYNNRRFILDMTLGNQKAGAYVSRYFNDLPSQHELDLPRGTVQIGGMFGPRLDEGEDEVGLSVFEITIRGERRPIAIIALGSDDARADTLELLSFILETYR